MTESSQTDGGRVASRALTSWQHARILLRHYSRYARLMRLHRPIGIWLLLRPTLWAVWVASAGHPDQRILRAQRGAGGRRGGGRRAHEPEVYRRPRAKV